MVINAFLVEDRADIRTTLVEAMEAITPIKFVGYAGTETAAKKWLGGHAGQWDLAIVDLFLDEGSGFGVLQECQGRGTLQKVVVLTNYHDQLIWDRCMQLGADRVFDKSEDLDKLVGYCKALAASLDDVAQTLP